MRRALIATIIALSLSAAACSPYDTPADATPAPPPTTTTTTVPCDQVCVEQIHRTYAYAAAVEAARISRIYAFAAAVERARIARIYAFAHAVEQARLARLVPPSGQCGGSLPPCYVMMRESRGNIHAQNPRSTASGKWQFLDSTWRRHRGYAKARHAPEWVQDERARQLWAGGRGCSHWSAC